MAYSQGFSPQPRLLFALPLSLGIGGKNEYLDLYLNEIWPESKLQEDLNAQLPEGLRIKDVCPVKSEQPSLSSQIQAALYIVYLPVVPENLPLALADLLKATTISYQRYSKKGVKKIDLRPFLYQLKISEKEGKEGKGMLWMFLAAGSQGGARPQEILAFLPLGGIKTTIYRIALFTTREGEFVTPAGEAKERFLEVFYDKEDCNQL